MGWPKTKKQQEQEKLAWYIKCQSFTSEYETGLALAESDATLF